MPERAGLLTYLELQGVGPARRMVFEPASRLNIITGDNGLGKSFLLDCSWWALTRKWANGVAYPRHDLEKDEIAILVGVAPDPIVRAIYGWLAHSWSHTSLRVSPFGLYVHADGAFSMWDQIYLTRQGFEQALNPPTLIFTQQVWDGLSNILNGFVEDLVHWQLRPDRYPHFKIFEDILSVLSPPEQSDLGKLKLGEPRRVLGEIREIPTLKHPYGEIPVTQASAGVKRILTLAYMLVWAWTEHCIQAELLKQEPTRQMVVLIDEVETHLHPQWQRVILPALLKVQKLLAEELDIQFIVTTHSPLVIASVEPEFNEETDKLFHLDLEREGDIGGEVILREVPFVRYGRVDNWLMSDVFELKEPRSVEAEQAIEDATSLHLQASPTMEQVKEVSERLMKYLAAHDEFWPRWLYFAEQHGVML